MKKMKVFSEGFIIDKRCFGEGAQPFCIHRVRFTNGKYGIVRARSGVCFNPGDIIIKNETGWQYDQKQVYLLAFEYVDENETIRQFVEY